MEKESSYYLIITSRVMQDTKLKGNEKLLYGVINGLCNQKGFCWAKNDYLAECLNSENPPVDETVSRYISNLRRRGHIEVNYRRNGSVVESRCISTTKATDYLDNGCEFNQPPLTKKSRAVDETRQSTVDQKVKENNKENNNKSINKKIEPGEVIDATDFSIEVKEKLKEFVEERKQNKKPVSEKAMHGLIGRLRKFSDTDAEAIEIIDNSIISGWSGFFELKKKEKTNGTNKNAPDVGTYL